LVQALDFISLSPCPFGGPRFSEVLLRELIDGALPRLAVPHGIERQPGRGSGIWGRHIGWRLRMSRANEQSERCERDIRFHLQPGPFTRSREQCEGATGSLAIVVSDRGPSHPCGLAQRIATASDAPRGAASWHVDVPRNARSRDWFREPTLLGRWARCCTRPAVVSVSETPREWGSDDRGWT